MAKVYPGINLCFLYGKIVSEIDFKFFYNNKIHSSIVEFKMEIDFEESSKKIKKQVLNMKAFDNQADYIYRKYKKDNYIKIIGAVNSQYITVKEIV